MKMRDQCMISMPVFSLLNLQVSILFPSALLIYKYTIYKYTNTQGTREEAFHD